MSDYVLLKLWLAKKEPETAGLARDWRLRERLYPQSVLSML